MTPEQILIIRCAAVFVAVLLITLFVLGLCRAAADIPVVREDTGEYDE